MKVILYPRVSSKAQLDSGDSIDAQINRLTNFSREKGFEIVDVYKDGGKSASFDEDSLNQVLTSDFFRNDFKLNKRPAFERLLREANSDKFEGIVFFKWDRFSRDIAFADLSRRYFAKYNIKLIPTDDSEDPFVSSLMGVINRQEIDKMKQRVREVRTYRFEQGIMPGRSPFGYEPIIKDKKIVGFKPKKKEAEIVKNVFQMASEGKDYKEICKKYNLKPQQYYNIIKNKVYIGIITFENKERKGIHEPLISEEVFNKLNDKI
jgi:site-specific DNA recombinase